MGRENRVRRLTSLLICVVCIATMCCQPLKAEEVQDIPGLDNLPTNKAAVDTAKIVESQNISEIKSKLPSDKVSKRKIKKIKKELKKNKMVYVRKKVDFSENFVELKAGDIGKAYVIDYYYGYSSMMGFTRQIVTSVFSIEDNNIYELMKIGHEEDSWVGRQGNAAKLVSFEKKLWKTNCVKFVTNSEAYHPYYERDMRRWGYLTKGKKFHYFGYSEIKPVKLFPEGRKIKDLSILPSPDGDNTAENISIVYSTELNNEYTEDEELIGSVLGFNLFGYGKDEACIMNCSIWASNPAYSVRVGFGHKAKDVFLTNEGGIFVRTQDNKVYYWGVADLKADEDFSKFPKEDVAGRLITYEDPLCVAEKIQSFRGEGDSVVVVGEDKNAYKISADSKLDEAAGKYYTQINKQLIHRGIDKYLDENIVVVGNKLHIKVQHEGDFFYQHKSKEKFPRAWWLRYADCPEEYDLWTKENLLLSNSVKDLATTFVKKDKWNILGSNGSFKEFNTFGIKKVALAEGENYICLDKAGCVWTNYADCIHFMYKSSEQTRKHVREERLVEENVDNVWADETNVVFVKNGKLHSSGEIEQVRWYYEMDQEHFPDFEPGKVKYSGINTNKISKVTFGAKAIYVIMKNGRVYKVKPDPGKVVANDKIKKAEKMKLKGVKDIGDDFVLTKSGKLTITRKVGKNKYVKTVEENVAEYQTNQEMHVILKKTGNLYGWGKNEFWTLSKKKVSKIKEEKKVLIAKKVKAFSLPTSLHSLYYLTKSGKLFFRGLNNNEFSFYSGMEYVGFEWRIFWANGDEI